jgi:hypothetical protein
MQDLLILQNGIWGNLTIYSFLQEMWQESANKEDAHLSIFIAKMGLCAKDL